MDKKKGGRPEVDDQDKRDVRVTIRFNLTEASWIGKAAAERTMAVSEFLRRQGLGRKLPAPVPAINREAWERTGKLMGGLTSIAQAAGAGEVPGWTDADRDLIRELKAEVAELRKGLKG